MNRSVLALAAILAACETPGRVSPFDPQPVALDYSYTNTVEGRCTIRPVVSVMQGERVHFTHVYLTEYGSTVYSEDSPKDFLNAASDTVTGQATFHADQFRIYAGGKAILQLNYTNLRNGQDMSVIHYMGCT